MGESVYIFSQESLHEFPPPQRTVILHCRAGEEAAVERRWYPKMENTSNLKQQFLFSDTVCVGSQHGRRGEQCPGMRLFPDSHPLAHSVVISPCRRLVSAKSGYRIRGSLKGSPFSTYSICAPPTSVSDFGFYTDVTDLLFHCSHDSGVRPVMRSELILVFNKETMVSGLL